MPRRVTRCLLDRVVGVDGAAVFRHAEGQHQQGHHRDAQLDRSDSARELAGATHVAAHALTHGVAHGVRLYWTRPGTSGPMLPAPPTTPEVAQGLAGSLARPSYSMYTIVSRTVDRMQHQDAGPSANRDRLAPGPLAAVDDRCNGEPPIGALLQMLRGGRRRVVVVIDAQAGDGIARSYGSAIVVAGTSARQEVTQGIGLGRPVRRGVGVSGAVGHGVVDIGRTGVQAESGVPRPGRGLRNAGLADRVGNVQVALATASRRPVTSLAPPAGGEKSIQLKLPVRPPPASKRPLYHWPATNP